MTTTPDLSSSYQVESQDARSFCKTGLVFNIVWPEPAGRKQDSTDSQMLARRSSASANPRLGPVRGVRAFNIVKSTPSGYITYPIQTYQAERRSNSTRHDHDVVHHHGRLEKSTRNCLRDAARRLTTAQAYDSRLIDSSKHTPLREADGDTYQADNGYGGLSNHWGFGGQSADVYTPGAEGFRTAMSKEVIPIVVASLACILKRSYRNAEPTRTTPKSDRNLGHWQRVGNSDHAGFRPRGSSAHDTGGNFDSIRVFSTTQDGKLSSASLSLTRLVTSAFNNAGPITLVIAAGLYIFAILLYWRQHERDIHKLKFVAGGVAAAFVLGIILGKPTKDIVVDYMPWGIIVGIILSSLYHYAARKMFRASGNAEKNDILLELGPN
ncbi:hypothetical protein BU16DRAFT_226392 [Lophium mytilinum]|uniref:Uncharacterized protein n=1 Tax=Lophium mytilinum TaxID=390894 RepID=A0A6A6Q8L9_9PEZI|nr:hypothetical protein BU16DRAFT_226392 [Lophium mytilinum]